MKQDDVDRAFWIDDIGPYAWGDCERIRSVISAEFSVNISMSEARRFWEWRSGRYDATWLAFVYGDEEIREWFQKFVDEHTYADDDDDDDVDEEVII